MKQPEPIKSAFHWQGPAQSLDKWGRMKTERQILLDATRVNQDTSGHLSTQMTNSYKAPR